MNEKDLQDQQCEYSPQALPEPTSTISCLHDRFLDSQLLPTPHLYFLYFCSMLDSLEKTLPRDSYLSEAYFAQEYAAIFESEWLCVGRTDALIQVGDYLTIRLHSESLLIVRGENGDLSAFYNTCRHRGTELVPLEDPGPVSGQFKRGIVCPYHAWSYHLDGRLRGTPYLAIDTEGVGLHSIALEEWAGFIFVCLQSRRNKTLSASLGEGTTRLQRYPLNDLRVGESIRYEVAANWKVIVENYNECYHCGPVHPELCRIVPAFRQGGRQNSPRFNPIASNSPQMWALVLGTNSFAIAIRCY